MSVTEDRNEHKEELNEGSKHGKDPFDRRVAVSMAIIAALLAIVSVLGHILSTEELLAQQKANDQWAYYQAKSIRRYNSEIARDLLKGLASESAAKSEDHYTANVAKYEKDLPRVVQLAVVVGGQPANSVTFTVT